MGPLHCADRREQGEQGVTRRWLGAAALVLVAAACNGDDDDDAVETSVTTATTPAPTTEATATSTTTTTTTTEPTTTTLSEDELKAQITADYLRAEQALEDLSRNPPSEGLDERVAAAVVSGSALHSEIVANLSDDVARGERVIAGDPDYSDVLVEAVQLTGDGTAEVTACVITNEIPVDAAGQPLDSANPLLAARVRQPMQRTDQGWLLASNRIRVDIREGVPSCAP
jgi:hypothetical protein